MTSANAQILRQARAGRTRMLRRRVIAGAVALFIAAWLVIGLILVSGHDPALAAHASTTTQSSSPSAAASGSDTSGSDSSSADGGTASSSGTGSSSGNGSASSASGATASASPSSVTTHSS